MEYKTEDSNKKRAQDHKDDEDDDSYHHRMIQQQRSIDEANLVSDHISRNLQKERQLVQEKIYINWLNYRLTEAPDAPQITNLYEDLKDGKILLKLLGVLTSRSLKQSNGNLRFHHINNLSKALAVLEEEGIKTIGIHAEAICDGLIIPVLGLCWSIIYRFQVVNIADDDNQHAGGAEKALLDWCKTIAKSYAASDVKNFQPNQWRKGYMLNAIIHSFNPKLFQYHTLTRLTDAERIQHALDVAHANYNLPQLFSATDFEHMLIDNKTLVLYVSMLREKKMEQEKKSMEKLLSELKALTIAIEKEENSNILAPSSKLSFSESKGISGQFKVFDKRLDELSNKVNQLSDTGKSIDCSEEDEKLLQTECDKLQNKLLNMKTNSKSAHESLKQNRIKAVRDKMDSVTNNVAAIKTEMEILSASVTENTSKDDLLKFETSIKIMLQKVSQMQAHVKGTCGLVDEAYSDKLLPKEERQALKNDAINVLDEYAKLMVALEKEQKRGQNIQAKVRTTEDKFALWTSRVTELNNWLSNRVNKYQDLLIEYGSLGNLKSVSSQNKHLIKEIGETWRKFEVLAAEWNSELCDKLNDDVYADVLQDIQTKFNKLNEIATASKTLINGMVHQKRAEDDLCSKLLSLKTYAEKKEEEINLERVPEKLEGFTKEIEDKDGEVKKIVKSAGEILRKNKYDENAVKVIETDLKVFCEQWDRLKFLIKEIKLKFDHQEQTQVIQKESKRNLVESLADWQKVLDGYSFKISEIDVATNGLHELEIIIAALRTLQDEISEKDGKVKEYDRNSTTLINTLENEDASNLNIEFQMFFKKWFELKEESAGILIRMQANYDKVLADEENLMGGWEKRKIVSEEWLDNVAKEIEVYAEMDDDDFDAYFNKLDDIEAKVNDETTALDETIEEQLILDQNKAAVKNVVDAFQRKKTDIHTSLQLVRERMSTKKEEKNLQKEHESLLKDELDAWKNILVRNEQTLDKCNVNGLQNQSETQNAVDVLEELLASVMSDDKRLDEFNSKNLLDGISPESEAAFNVDFKLFLKSWDHSKDKIKERLNSLEMHLNQLLKTEGYLMNDWDLNASKSALWLDASIEESATYDKVPDTLHEMQSYISNYEELSRKVTDKAISISEVKIHGKELLESGKVQQLQNVEKIEGDILRFNEKLDIVHCNLSTANSNITIQLSGIISKKLEDFDTWLPAIRKRTEEGDEIGPDFDTVGKQIQEMKVIETQTLQMSFIPILEDERIIELLSSEEKEKLKIADEKWQVIRSWVNKRLESLAKTESLWDEFKRCKVDLMDYLRDVENELNDACGFASDDTTSVETRSTAFKTVTSGMETRKYHVAKLVDVADQLIDLISEESGADCSSAVGITSQVTDILDLWNSHVKRSIELQTILHASCKKQEAFEKLFGEIHEWVANVSDILDQFTVDARGEHIAELRASLEEHQSQEEEIKSKLDELNHIDEELSKIVEIPSQYTLEGSITELNEDFNTVSTQLEQLRKFRGKARILSRQIRGGTRRLFMKSEEEGNTIDSIQEA